jgi:phosphoribosyl-ATP pyrophosphohydrolase/phosphoribosyl-AMP cyclohydrolase
MDTDFLQTLETIIASRRDADAMDSYTASLFEAGVRRIAQKVGEEGVELALAATDGARDEVINEAADLVYHLLVLLNARDVALTDVVAALEARHAEHP